MCVCVCVCAYLHEGHGLRGEPGIPHRQRFLHLWLRYCDALEVRIVTVYEHVSWSEIPWGKEGREGEREGAERGRDRRREIERVSG